MIYLIGENGFLGSAIKKCLIKNKIKFKGINRKNYKKFIGTNCEILINASTNSSKFISENNFQKDYKLTVNNVIKTIKDFNFNKYVLVSSSEVYQNQSYKNSKEDCSINPEFLSNYGLNKIIAENILKRSVKSWLIIRCGGMIGENLKKNPIYDLINKKVLRVSLRSKFQFIDTEEVASCILKLLTKNINNEIFNLSAKKNISLLQLVDHFKLKPIILQKKMPILNYDINTDKINEYFNIKNTKYYLYKFLKTKI